jgi:hypothetical protein
MLLWLGEAATLPYLFLAVDFLAVDFFADDFLPDDFFAVDFFAAVFAIFDTSYKDGGQKTCSGDSRPHPSGVDTLVHISRS